MRFKLSLSSLMTQFCDEILEVFPWRRVQPIRDVIFSVDTPDRGVAYQSSWQYKGEQITISVTRILILKSSPNCERFWILKPSARLACYVRFWILKSTASFSLRVRFWNTKIWSQALSFRNLFALIKRTFLFKLKDQGVWFWITKSKPVS